MSSPLALVVLELSTAKRTIIFRCCISPRFAEANGSINHREAEERLLYGACVICRAFRYGAAEDSRIKKVRMCHVGVVYYPSSASFIVSHSFTEANGSIRKIHYEPYNETEPRLLYGVVCHHLLCLERLNSIA
jgi:hypothetical protein